jgi:hypothetical protein
MQTMFTAATTATATTATKDSECKEGSPEYYDMVWSLDEVKSFASLVYGSVSDGKKGAGLEDEIGVVALMCRRKYDANVYSDSCLASLTFDPSDAGGSDLTKKLSRLQTRHGSFHSTPKNNADDADGAKENNVPASGMAIYITLHPRSMLAAWKAVNREVDDHLIELAKQKTTGRPVWQPRKLVSFLSKAAMSTHPQPSEAAALIDLDIDTRDPKWLSALNQLLRDTDKNTFPAVVACVETRGGYHVILSRQKLSKSQLGNLHALSNKTTFKKSNVNGEMVTQRLISVQNANCIVPLPGTRQANYHVRLIPPHTILTSSPSSPSSPSSST